jgi:hypothetical protein
VPASRDETNTIINIKGGGQECPPNTTFPFAEEGIRFTFNNATLIYVPRTL